MMSNERILYNIKRGYPEILEAAQESREYALRKYSHTNLEGACNDVSNYLVDRILEKKKKKRYDVDTEDVVIYDGDQDDPHTLVVCKNITVIGSNVYIDVTMTQFGDQYPEIYIGGLPEIYHTSYRN